MIAAIFCCEDLEECYIQSNQATFLLPILYSALQANFLQSVKIIKATGF